MTPRILEPFTVILFFGLFLLTLHPTITAGDSGEIVAAGFSLGIPHPPGYPLYTIVSKLLTLSLPFGSIAYRVNVVSAIFGALSCLMVYMITSKIIQSGVRSQESGANVSRLPALFASLSLSLSYEFWYRSTVAEVYTLNAFLVLLIIYILQAWRERAYQESGVRSQKSEVIPDSSQLTAPSSRLLYLTAFLLGLGIGNHHTIVLLIPGALAFVLWSIVKSGVRSQKSEVGSTTQLLNLSTSFPRLTSHVSRLTFFFLLGISIYLYLPIRSAQNPFMDWGDPQILSYFIDVFTRKVYLPESVERPWGRLIEQARTFDPIHEFAPIGFSAGLIGIWSLWNIDRKSWTMLVLTFVLASYGLIFLAGGGAGDMDLLKKFYVPSYAVFSIFTGVGMMSLLGGQGVKGSRGQGTRTLESWNPWTLAVLSISIASLIWQFSVHWPRTQNSNNYLAYDYGMNELNSLPYGATYISKGEIKTFPLWYLQGAERYREDVKVITAYFLTQKWYLPEVLRLVGVPRGIPKDRTYKQMLIDTVYRGNAERGVYTGFLDEEYIPGGLLTYAQGITFQLYKVAEEKRRLDVWPGYQLRGIRSIEGKMDRGIVEILKDYASSHYNAGLEYYDEGDIDRAMTEFEKALAINSNDPDSLHNLAALYAEKGVRLKEAEGMAKRAFELYTGEKDREMAKETMEEILKTGSRGRGVE